MWLPINNKGSPQHSLTKAISKLSELLFKGPLLVAAQTVFEQPRDDLAHPDTDAAEEHQEFAVCFVHGSTSQTDSGFLQS
jgi:hypothetical protein